MYLNHERTSLSRWGILFSHPADYTPVCTTELSRAAKLAPEFAKRNTKLIGLSCDTIDNHHGWIKVCPPSALRTPFDLLFSQDLQAYSAGENQCTGEFSFPIIDDSDRKLAKQLGMIDPDEFDNKGLPLTARAVRRFIVLHFTLSRFPFVGVLYWSR